MDCGTDNTLESKFCIVCSSENLIEVDEKSPAAKLPRIFPTPKISRKKLSPRSAVPLPTVPEDFTFTDGPVTAQDVSATTEILPDAGIFPDMNAAAQPDAVQNEPSEPEKPEIVRDEQTPDGAAQPLPDVFSIIAASEPDAPGQPSAESTEPAETSEPTGQPEPSPEPPVSPEPAEAEEGISSNAGADDDASANIDDVYAGAPQNADASNLPAERTDLTEFAAVQHSESGDTICPYCKNAMVASTDVFCPACGRNIEQLNYGKVLHRAKCPQCGTSNDINSRICAYCFTQLSGDELDIFTVDYTDAARSGNEVIRKAVLVSQTGKKWQLCSGCGALSELSETICSKCASKLEISFEKKFCPSCGSENSFDAQFCYHCRYSFTGGAAAEDVWRCGCSQLNDESSLYCIKCGKLYAKKK